jgi:hypothetical protein
LQQGCGCHRSRLGAHRVVLHPAAVRVQLDDVPMALERLEDPALLENVHRPRSAHVDQLRYYKRAPLAVRGLENAAEAALAKLRRPIDRVPFEERIVQAGDARHAGGAGWVGASGLRADPLDAKKGEHVVVGDRRKVPWRELQR